MILVLKWGLLWAEAVVICPQFAIIYLSVILVATYAAERSSYGNKAF